jgi:hypothetical protein
VGISSHLYHLPYKPDHNHIANEITGRLDRELEIGDDAWDCVKTISLDKSWEMIQAVLWAGPYEAQNLLRRPQPIDDRSNHGNFVLFPPSQVSDDGKIFAALDLDQISELASRQELVDYSGSSINWLVDIYVLPNLRLVRQFWQDAAAKGHCLVLRQVG